MTCDHIHNTHNTHNTQYTLIYAAESASEDSSPPKRRWPRAAHRKSRAPARQTCTPQSAPPPAPRTSTPADGAPPTTSVSWRTNVSTHKCQYARRTTHECQYARRTPSPGQWARTPSVVTYPMTPGPPRGQELRPKLPHSRFITRERERSPRRDRSGPSRGRSSTPRLVSCPRRASVPRSRALFRRPRQHHAKRPPPRSRRTPRRIYGWMCR
jgi:hypothetical protein